VQCGAFGISNSGLCRLYDSCILQADASSTQVVHLMTDATLLMTQDRTCVAGLPCVHSTCQLPTICHRLLYSQVAAQLVLEVLAK